MEQATSSQEHAAVLTRSMIRESRDCLKKNSGVPKCCACVAKPIVATLVAPSACTNGWSFVTVTACECQKVTLTSPKCIIKIARVFYSFRLML